MVENAKLNGVKSDQTFLGSIVNGSDQLQSGTTELSGVTEIFCILTLVGLPDHMCLSKVIELYT